MVLNTNNNNPFKCSRWVVYQCLIQHSQTGQNYLKNARQLLLVVPNSQIIPYKKLNHSNSHINNNNNVLRSHKYNQRTIINIHFHLRSAKLTQQISTTTTTTILLSKVSLFSLIPLVSSIKNTIETTRTIATRILCVWRNLNQKGRSNQLLIPLRDIPRQQQLL